MDLVIEMQVHLCFGEVQGILMYRASEHKRCTCFTNVCASNNNTVTPRLSGHCRGERLATDWSYLWLATTVYAMPITG